ncbi:hypothetical protein ACF0H5_007885 [Mactra antiquata]
MISRTYGNLFLTFYFCVVFNVLYVIGNLDLLESQEQGCRMNCDYLMEIDGDGYYCDEDCQKRQCYLGCSNFTQAISEAPCSTICTRAYEKNGTSDGDSSSTIQTRVQSCVQGCNFGLEEYHRGIVPRSGLNLPGPEIVKDGIAHSSVLLEWNGDNVYTTFSDVKEFWADTFQLNNYIFILQKQVIETKSEWQSHSSVELLESGRVNVTDLHPFITYRFKFIFQITTSLTVETNYSIPVTTLPYGVPSGSPTITSLHAPSPTMVSVSWEPPVYANGPLLSYRMSLSLANQKPSVASAEVSPAKTSWIFGYLEPGTQYEFSILAVNSLGEGPAQRSTITTPVLSELDEKLTPYLILGAENYVVKQSLPRISKYAEKIFSEEQSILVMDNATLLFQSNSSDELVQGVAVHVDKELVLVSDDSGKITLIDIDGRVMREDVYSMLGRPMAIDIDWLHNKAYITDGHRIYQCTIQYDWNCSVVTDLVPYQPLEIKVDPINGFLYYTLRYEDGLYSIELTDFTLPVEPVPKLIINNNIRTFFIDYENLLLYYPNTTHNTIMSAYLDGSGVTDMRSGTVKRPHFLNIESIVYYDRKFFWTNGSKIFSERYDSANRTYYHYSVALYEKHFASFNLYHQNSQPVPVPLNPPEAVQVLFTAYKAIIDWKQPKMMSFQGQGAFNNWQYEILIKEKHSSNYEMHDASKEMKLEVTTLQPDTEYEVMVRAKSRSGYGPWSSTFHGKTLRKDLDTAELIVAVAKSHGVFITWDIIQVGLDGEINKRLVQPSLNYPGVTDLSWSGDMLFWTSREGFTFVYQKERDYTTIDFMKSAKSVTYDWLGERLYWSTYRPGDSQIRRADIYGDNEEFVFQTEAKDMTLDSIQGRLYWVTTESVESTFLNGKDHFTYFKLEPFSGVRVISLTIDLDHQKLFWYVKAHNDQSLYTADLYSSHSNKDELIKSVKLVGKVANIYNYSSIQYFSDRLYWIDERSSLRVSDTNGDYSATMPDIDDDVVTFIVKHKSLHSYPDGMNASTVYVIPGDIKADSITCIGEASKFNVTWQPPLEVNHGKVMYEVNIQAKGLVTVQEVLDEPWYEIKDLVPYTPITVSVRASTYWGTGPGTEKIVKSPMAAPSIPMLPKVYVSQRKNAAVSKLTLAADFRWTEPELLNGMLNRQNVYYWQSDNPDQVSTTTLPASSRHFILDDLQGSITYFFQVECCTEAGCGPRSHPVNATADSVNPVPKLLIATKNGIHIAESDNVRNATVNLTTKSVVAISYLSQDEQFYWITSDKYLEEFPPMKKMMHLKGESHKMTLDWVSRTLYIAESNLTSDSGTIISYNLDERKQHVIMKRQSKIADIVVDPYTSSLLWTEYNPVESSWNIMHTTTNDPTSVSNFFQNDRVRRDTRDDCNCPQNQRVLSAMTVDLSADGHTQLIYYDAAKRVLASADMSACKCKILLKTDGNDTKGLPGDYMTVDHVFIYWYNKSEQRLHTMDKATKSLSSTKLERVTDIQAYGAHLHPLPGVECLDMQPYTDKVEIVSYTNISINVQLKDIVWPDTCESISHPAAKYTIYYKLADGTKFNDDCHEDKHTCIDKTSYSREIIIDQLEPYTHYIIQGAVSNYYSEYSVKSLGEVTRVRTKSGVPSAVVIVEASPRSPDSIRVEWLPPVRPNGPTDKIVYLLKWITKINNTTHTFMTDAIKFDTKDPFFNGLFGINGNDLQPDQTYSVQVICNQTDGGYITESDSVLVTTYQAPNDLELHNVTNTSMVLMWQSPADDSTLITSIYNQETESIVSTFKTDNNTWYNATFDGLTPNTDYSFRLHILYNSTSQFDIYYWPKKDSDIKYVFRTLTGIPDAPVSPEIKEYKDGEYEVTWITPEDHGEMITHYILQYRYVDKANWTDACNSSELRWVINDKILQRGFTYMFRVKAENKNGWGPYSLNSTLFSYPILEEESMDGMITVVAVVIAFSSVVFAMIIIAICFSMCRRRRDEKMKKNQEFVAVSRGPDLELATLRELPMTHVQHTNTLYALNIIPTDDEIAALPHFRRDQLVLCKFLGSGAFGEVFEGIAKNIINESSGDTRCAVKTLRKSASDQEKEEFLKEALLMSNFHHDHILSLLGVCLDNDPQFIILELMEGGDLLSFLRACRLSSIQNQNRAELSLTDLVKICVHVASGCKYLEDMHFVHRDLAARNCLVSSCNPSTMVVKIGDFGLARDIYKNDYYRKEGEGLLPVRWMSPESLVDGVFTTQSDIWAFGVLMWEVVTFGQQPYPARTNIDVLHFVRSGGRLDKHECCPDDFYHLMCKCWSFEPEDRPSFSFLLQQLEKFHETCTSISEYLIPIRSSNRTLIAVDGLKYQTTYRIRRTVSTSSDGPEYSHINHTGYDHHKSYGNIRRATSFDSPEPKDATQQVRTDAANYLEPRSNYVPPYFEFLPEERTVNYMYNSEGERIKDKEIKIEENVKPGPNYVQTTVKENFGAQGHDYAKYVNQKSRSVSDQDTDSEVKRIFSHQKNSADSVIMKTIENIPNALNNSTVSRSDSVFTPSYNSTNTVIIQNGVPHINFKKHRLDSTTSVMSFDSVQTEPVYNGFHRSKLYSSSSSKSNYSMTNISEAGEPISPDTHPKKFWANTSMDCENVANKMEHKSHVDYLNMTSKSQIYSENMGPLSGYDIVHASLV